MAWTMVAVPSQPYLVPNIRDTRGHAVLAYIPTIRTVVYQNSFFPASIRLWNNLPATVVSSLNIDAFRSRLAQVLPGEPGQFHLWPGRGQGS